MAPRLPLSGVIITYNEADRVGAVVQALATLCEEVLVVDSGSTDGTQALCESLGARVVYHPFASYGLHKRYAVTQAQHDWVLLLDADEVPDAPLLAAIRGCFAGQEPAVHGFAIARTLVFLGRTFSHGKESRQLQYRLFDRRHAEVTTADLHDAVVVQGPTPTLPGRLLHHSYRSLSDYLTKFNKYTTLTANELRKQGKSRSQWYTIASWPLYFIKQYFIYGNWRNGYPGLIWSLLSASYPVVKYWKIYEAGLRGPVKPHSVL
jgi:glycosyltransferase involved in cell wall biosynthesis